MEEEVNLAVSSYIHHHSDAFIGGDVPLRILGVYGWSDHAKKKLHRGSLVTLACLIIHHG